MITEMERLLLRVDTLSRGNQYLQQKVREKDKEIEQLKLSFAQQAEKIKLLEDENAYIKRQFARLENEFRKYHNENTPSGALPPYLKEPVKIEKEKEDKPDGRSLAHDNKRNARPRHCDRTERLEMTNCPCCGDELSKVNAEPNERKIMALRISEVEHVRYLLPRYYCRKCRKEFSPKVPNTIPNSKFDINLILAFSVLTTQSKLSVDDARKIMKTFFKAGVSKAAINNHLLKFRRYLGPDYAKLEAEIMKEKVIHRDETGCRKNGKLNWIWAAVTKKRAFFRILAGRGRKEAEKFQPSRKSKTVCDGYGAYNGTTKEIQRCWAHLTRKLDEPEHWSCSDKEIDEYVALAKNIHSLFSRAKKDKEKFGVSVDLRKKYDEELLKILQYRGLTGVNRDAITNYIMSYWEEWFVFLQYNEVEPTNNRAERALRHLVLKRRISQQNRSTFGQEALQMQESIYMTCHLQGKDYMETLRHAVERETNDAGKL